MLSRSLCRVPAAGRGHRFFDNRPTVMDFLHDRVIREPSHARMAVRHLLRRTPHYHFRQRLPCTRAVPFPVVQTAHRFPRPQVNYVDLTLVEDETSVRDGLWASWKVRQPPPGLLLHRHEADHVPVNKRESLLEQLSDLAARGNMTVAALPERVSLSFRPGSAIKRVCVQEDAKRFLLSKSKTWGSSMRVHFAPNNRLNPHNSSRSPLNNPWSFVDRPQREPPIPKGHLEQNVAPGGIY